MLDRCPKNRRPRLFPAAMRGFGHAAALAVALAGLAKSATAAELRLTTEENPPYNFTDPDTAMLTGIVTEVVEATMRRAGVAYRIELLPWQRAYAAALKEQNTCVFATNRTEAREALFSWVSPIVRGGWVLFARADDDISLASIEDARPFKIAVPQGSAFETWLTEQGFQTEISPSDFLNPQKLKAGRIRLWGSGRHTGPYTARLRGNVAVREVLFVRESIVALACNPATDALVIAQLNAALEAIRAEGAIARIEARYR